MITSPVASSWPGRGASDCAVAQPREQKARNSLYAKNDLALAMLDFAQKHNFILANERKGRLSTVQRYLGNPVFRNTLGLDGKLPLLTNLPYADFDLMLRKFVRDVVSKNITTRDNAKKIGEYKIKAIKIQNSKKINSTLENL